MKKALVVLLILAVAGGAFAQMVFTGSVQSGLVLQMEGNNDPALRFFSMDAGTGARFTLQGSYTNADGNAGINFNLRSNASTTSTNGALDGTHGNGTFIVGEAGTTYIENGYGWLKAFNGMLTLYGGKVDNGTFGTAGGVDADLDEGIGLMAIVTPITNLNLGVAVYTDAFDVVAADGLKNHMKIKAHFNYKNPDLFNITAGFRSTRWQGASGGGFVSIDKSQDAYVGFNFLGLASSGVTNLSVDAFMYNIGAFADNGEMEFGERFEMTVASANSLGIGLRMRQYLLTGSNYDGKDPNIGFWAWAFYPVTTSVVPRLDVGYEIGTYRSGIDPRRTFYDGMNFKSGWSFDYSSLEIRPSVQFRFSGTGNYAELGYAAYVNMGVPSGVKTLSNIVYCDYKVSF